MEFSGVSMISWKHMKINGNKKWRATKSKRANGVQYRIRSMNGGDSNRLCNAKRTKCTDPLLSSFLCFSCKLISISWWIDSVSYGFFRPWRQTNAIHNSRCFRYKRNAHTHTRTPFRSARTLCVCTKQHLLLVFYGKHLKWHTMAVNFTR